MSNYTTELRFICETYAGLDESAGFNEINAIISAAIPKIFDFPFPIFDEEYRNVLCTKILKHYYTREICCETVGRWKLFLDSRLNEIMPMYNRLYEAVNEKVGLLNDFDMTTEHKGNSTQTAQEQSTRSGIITSSNRVEHDSSTDNTSNRNHVQKYSETPQSGLIGVLEGNYLTSATVNDNEDVSRTSTDEVSINNGDSQSNDNLRSDNNTNSTEDYVTHVYGKSHGVSYGKALKELSENLVDVDMKIIDELEDLFMQIW